MDNVILDKFREVWAKHDEMNFSKACFVFIFGYMKYDKPELMLEMDDEIVLERLNEVLNHREKVHEKENNGTSNREDSGVLPNCIAGKAEKPSENREAVSAVVSEVDGEAESEIGAILG